MSEMSEHCTLCPRKCGANRAVSRGYCGEGNEVRIARAALHFGEEPCISGKRGSGAVFFSGCAMKCRFCQNREISFDGVGETVSGGRLCEIFKELQSQGAETLNLVTPSHFAPQVAEALARVKKDLRIPVVCNCSGYESDEILRILSPYVDVWLPDLKFFSPERSTRYASAPDYFEVALRAIKAMFEAVGPCRFSEDGILQKGVLIRHLVLPGGKSDSIEILRRIAAEFDAKSVRVSVMRQYVPCGDLSDFPELRRTVFSSEYSAVLAEADRLALIGYSQGRGCATTEMTPDFDLTGVRKESV